MQKRLLFVFISFFFLNQISFGQLVSTNSLTPVQLVQQVLLGPGVVATNISFTGNQNQLAEFTSTAGTNLGLPHGILISTGNALTSSADGPQGPNGAGGTSTGYGGAGDAYLTTLSGQATEDAGILEFDFVPQGDTVKFRYVFASEEYPEYVNSKNDAFALILSGVAPTVLAPVNIATIPVTTSTTNVVSINNVNGSVNSTYYTNNGASVVNIEFDGLTTILTAKHKVNCGETYHIKIAIADGGDDVWDSGVFLEAGSFSSLPPITVSSSNSNASFTDSVMVEDCNTNCIYFVRTANVSQKDSFMLQVSGNGILGTDYVQQGNPTFAWPTKLVFNANQDTIIFCDLKALQDNMPEGLDTLIFTLNTFTTSAGACIVGGTIKFKIYISDYHALEITQGDSVICNGLGIVLDADPKFGVPSYTYSWAPSAVSTSTLFTGPVASSTIFTISVNDICNKPVTKQITVTPSTLPELSSVSSNKFCLDSVAEVHVSVSGGNLPINYMWYAPLGGMVPYDTVSNTYYIKQTVTPSAGNYTIVITDQCNKRDTVRFDLETVDCTILVPNVITTNGDNVNDIFKINGLDHFPNSSLFVFNRWGKKIYTSENYKNDWKPEGMDGTYFYVLDVSDGRKFSGFFQVYH